MDKIEDSAAEQITKADRLRVARDSRSPITIMTQQNKNQIPHHATAA